MEALQGLQDHGHISFGLEERTETAAGPLPASSIRAADAIEAAKSGYEYRPDDGGATWTLVKKVQQPVLRIDPEAVDSPEMRALAKIFKIKPGLSRYDVTLESLNPFPSTYPGAARPDATTTYGPPLAVPLFTL